MHQIVVFSKDSQATMLWFRTKEGAQTTHESIITSSDIIKASDDFGATLSIPGSSVSHIVYNDLSKQAELYKLLEGMGYAKKN